MSWFILGKHKDNELFLCILKPAYFEKIYKTGIFSRTIVKFVIK